MNERKQPANEAEKVREREDTLILGLTEEQARLILKGDVANIIRKVKAGRTLSASERTLLATSSAGGKPSAATHVTTQAELADIIGVSRKSIARWRKLPGNPGTQPDGRYSVAEWVKFKRDQMGEDAEDPSAAELKLRQLQLQIEKLEHHLGVVRREYVPAAEVEKWGAKLGVAIRKVVAQIHLVAPSVVGVSVPEAEARLKEIEADVLQQLHLLTEAAQEYRPPQEDGPGV